MADIKKLNGYFLKDEQARGSIAGHIADDTKHVTASEKAGWDGKYQKPGTGIPKGDLAESVKGSLDKADSALQEHQSLAAYRTATAQDVIDGDMQEQIDALASRADVVDVVGTRAELAEYDTSLLTQDDVIKVLEDETKDDAIAYYRWVITAGSGAWTFVGTQGPFYTKSEADVLLNAKQDAITDLETIRNGAAGNVKHTSQTLTVAQQMQARANQGLYYSEYEATAEPIEWDGNTDGRASFTVSAAGTNMTYYKVSGAVLHKSDVVGGTYYISAGGHSMTQDLTDGNVGESDGLTTFISYVSANAGVYYGGAYDVPEDGTYYGVPAGTGIPDDFVARLEFPAEETVHSIEAKYIPVSHETWTFTLEDDTTVDKEVVLWTSEA